MPDPIITYEHKALYYGTGEQLTEPQWKALTAFHAKGKNDCFFDIIHRGVKFKSYVGVLRVGKLTIEVLPKLDDNDSDDHWRDRLLDMLRVVTKVTSHHPSTAHLRTCPHDILNLYLQLFADELEQLLRGGLAKAYHGRQGNRTALRGRLLMSRHLTENLLHKERFYVADTTYDHQHPLNQILRQALDLARRLAVKSDLQNRLAELDLRFPCLPELKITEDLFRRIRYDCRTTAYRPAVEIARLLLLNFHPDLRNGHNDVLALLFNMNRLWEEFLLRSLQLYLNGYRVQGQRSDLYWESPVLNDRMTLRPDITVWRDGKEVAILDAKWKRFRGAASGDLHQLFAYANHFGVSKVALVYPHADNGVFPAGATSGKFVRQGDCDILLLPVEARQHCSLWMKQLAATVADWLP